MKHRQKMLDPTPTQFAICIHRLREMSPTQLQSMSQTVQTILEQSLSQSQLCGQLCDFLEKSTRI
jgi:hypothetical protein